MPNAPALAVLAGLASVALYLALLSGLPIMVLLAYFVQLPLLFVGLTIGLAGSVIAAASGVLACGLIAGAVAALIYTVVQAVPALFVVRQTLLSRATDDGRVEWYPPGLLISQLAVVAAAGIAVAFLVMSAEPGGFQGALERFLQSALAELGAVEVETDTSPEMADWMFVIPGLMAASWLIMVTLNCMLAQAAAVRLGWNRRPSPAFDAIELPRWLLPCVGVTVLLSMLGDGDLGFLGRATLIALTVPYGFLGLALIHVAVRRWPHPGLALIVIYGSILVFGWPIMVVVLLGFAEDFAELRRRLT